MFLSFTDLLSPYIYTLSLHDALPIFARDDAFASGRSLHDQRARRVDVDGGPDERRPAAARDLDRPAEERRAGGRPDRKSTRLNSSHRTISYAVFCLKKKKNSETTPPD